MASTQTVIIDFQADYSSLQTGIDLLEQTGKVDKELADQFRKTNTEINKQGQAFDKAAQSAAKDVQSFGKLNDLMKQFPKSGLNRFLLQVGNEFAAAGVSADLFFKKSKEGNDLVLPKFDSLKLQLAAVKKRMEEAAKTSGTLSKEYLALKEQAGQLSAAIKDINSDIANTGSDTKNIDNIVGSISALAGGYSAIQGATALFGEESEDLQKSLLKVNAAMALATGLQTVANALTKTGSLTRLADAAATGAQTVAQRLYTIVVGQSVGALKLLRIAIASTGIGLLILAVSALINKFGNASDATQKLSQDLKDLRETTDAAIEGLRRQGDLTEQILDEAGSAESERTAARRKNLKEEEVLEQSGLEKLRTKRKELKQVANELGVDNVKGLKKLIAETDAAIDVSEKNIREIFFETQIVDSKIRKQKKDEEKKAADERKKLAEEYADKQKELNDKALEASKKARAAEFADFKAGVELQLLASEEGSLQQLEIRKRLMLAQLQIDLEGENITQNQRKLLIQQFFKDSKDLQKKFNQELSASALEDQKNRLSAELENLNLNEEDKLSARISFLQISAAEEIAAAEGNAPKILAINAKLQADITAAKVDAIRKAAQYEIDIQAAQGGPAKRALEAVASNERMKADIRINAIRQLQQLDVDGIDKQIKANRAASEVIGSDQQALALEYQQLLDQKAAATEATEKKITDITIAENDRRRESDIAYIQATLQGLNEVASIISGIQANQQEASDAAIERKRKEVAELLESGAITEKDALARSKKIEAEERAAKNRAAQQQKNLAVFNAFLAIPQAFIAGLTAPFPIGGPIYGGILAGLAAVQASIVAARPVPKFATGKKGSYEGAGIVGDAGSELVHRADGSMWVASKPTLTYLGSRDKVFTASETKQMMPFVNKEAINATAKGIEFDYEKLAKAVGKSGKGSVTNVDINKDFVSESVVDGLHKTNYFNKYYNSKG